MRGRAIGSWRTALYASLGLGVALGVLLHEQLLHLYSTPDLGDPLFSIWRVACVNHQIVADPRHLFDTNIFYPERLTLTLSDPVILPALTIAPLLAIGVHPIVAYNLLLFSGFWFSGIAVYLLVHRLTESARAAFVAGLVYACYAYRFDHYSHLELQMTQWMPLGLLALHRFIDTRRWPYAIALGLAGVAQLYSSMYYAVFFIVYAALIAIGLVVVERPPIRQLIAPLAASAVLAAVLAIPLARAFAAAEAMKGERGIEEISYYSAKPVDYLRAPKNSAVWRNVMRRPIPERTLFPGAAPLTLAAIGVAPPLAEIRLLYAAGLLLSFDGSLGYNGFSYPRMHDWIAPFRGLRAPARFGALVGMTLAILAGFGAKRAMAWRGSRRYGAIVFAALIAFVMIDAWPALALRPVWREPPSIYEPLRGSGAVLAEFPIEDEEAFNAPYMYFSTWHWLPMVNGYSGFIPESYHQLIKRLTTFPSDDALAALRERGVTHVTVNCGLMYPGCTELLHETRFKQSLRLITDTTWEGQPVHLYELTAPQPISAGSGVGR